MGNSTALETGGSLHRGPVEGGWFYWDFERQMKVGSGNGTSLSLSLGELCKGNLEGGLHSGDTEGYVKEGSGNGPLSP